MAKKTPQAPILEDLFELPDDYLHGPSKEALRPGLIEVSERKTRQDRVLKIWWKTDTEADAELRELWRHEKLQTDRLMSYPGADDLMVGVVDMVETADAFCVVHEHGSVPLPAKLRTASSRHWIKSLAIPSNRKILWGNLARLARALGIIHSRGLVHGRIDSFSIFTEGAQFPDFRLGGFEWSLVLGEPRLSNPSMQQIRSRIDRLIYSYAEDWKSLGIIMADLLGLDPECLREDDPYNDRTDDVELYDSEIELVRRLVDPTSDEVLETKEIVSLVDAINKELSERPDTRNAKLILVFSPNAKMAEAIYETSDHTIFADDIDGQSKFVEADLANGVRLVAPADEAEFDRLVLLTESMSYQIKPHSDDSSVGWKVAIIVSIWPRTENSFSRNSQLHRVSHPVDIYRNTRDALRAVDRLKNSVVEWTLPIAPSVEVIDDSETRTLRRAVLLVQVLEALLKYLEIIPVEVVSWRVKKGRTVFQLAPRATERDRIADEIGHRTAELMMEQLFDKDDLGIDVEWRLSSSGGLGSRSSAEVSARFLAVDRDASGQKVFEFSVDGIPPDDKSLFLRRKGDFGTESLIRRRLRTSQVLASQRDLVAMFADPRRRSKISADGIQKDSFFDHLDEPKQKALEALWTVAPTYFVVGPPGVGKTKLITEVMRRKLADEPAIRVLISAQNHQALDHTLRETKKAVVGPDSNVILVRSPGKEGAISTDADVRETAINYLKKVLQSELISEVPPPLQQAVKSLQETFERPEEEIALIKARDAEGVRALTSLVLESANLVFSTSTSLDIERLIEDGAQFDWVVIEEAAKASGPDLIAPLSLSGRRLLIGDHNQLPPFDADRINDILLARPVAQRSLKAAEGAVGFIFLEFGLDDLLRSVNDEDSFNDVCAMARRVVEPFRALVEEDADRREFIGGIRKAVSSELLVQHRMDPAIAELVSKCFYKNRLITSDYRTEKAKLPLDFSFGSPIPASPIVFVDLPWASRTGDVRPRESGRPRWHNPTEAGVVADLLRRLETINGIEAAPPSLAVLAPYRAQMERLSRQVDAVRSNSIRNSGISAFSGFTHDGRICGTVDSAQGSEADLVVVSLVRNNHQTGVSALGFLRDSRRMNVLLSRARKQLVIVGSLEFLRESSRYATSSDDDELAFILRFLKTLDELRLQKTVRGDAAAAVIPISALRSGPRK